MTEPAQNQMTQFEEQTIVQRTLQQADSGNINPFIEYIAKNLCRSLEIMTRGAKSRRVRSILY